MEYIRSFIAIELPQEVKEALSRIQAGLRGKGGGYVRWVDTEGIHLTLKFLGNVAWERLPMIVQAISQSCPGIPPFSLELGGLGLFPNPHRPRVVWVGVKGEAERLAQLQQRLEGALAPLGFPAESRSFTPHLTLARLREEAPAQERQSFGQAVLASPGEVAHPFQVESVSLMRSQLTPGGAQYFRLASISLEKGLSSGSI